MTILIKANGEQEEFSDKKLLASIQRAGIPLSIQPQVIEHVHEKLHEGMKTKEIYQHILEFLDTKHPFSKAKYALKQSIMDLGPTGYPFEKFISRVLDTEGFTTITNQLIKGKCVTHEVDVVATKDKEKLMVEAKFHNGPGVKTDVQVSLYTHARFLDIQQNDGFNKALLITNTKATTDAIAYAQCVGMEIITWSYPEGRGLRGMVEAAHLHPITSLSTLSQGQKQQLLEQNIVLCREIAEHPEVLNSLGIAEKKKEEIINEASFACSKTE